MNREKPLLTGNYSEAPTLNELNATLAASIKDWPRFEACPVCADRTQLFATIRHLPHDRCRACGFRFANPYPPETVCDQFYNSGFFSNYRTLEERKRREDRYFSMSMYTDPRELARIVASHSPERVLDYGCGTGAFLALLRDEFGIQGDGLEIGESARESAREYGLDVASSVEELACDSYDMVLLLEVIEHVPNPGKFFGEVAKLVSTGGMIVITTPAVDNILGSGFPELCAHYTAPSHVSLFTIEAMRQLLARFSFNPVHLATDQEWGVARTAALSRLYKLDFASPQHDEDTNDALYVPTRLGRWRGRSPTRTPTLGRMVSGLASFADRAVARVFPRPNHIYVVAEKRV
jgi:2-polyprenyl-3-methyl-5-hydroxy-6-metoxy-1,4-benzoquinol methylase